MPTHEMSKTFPYVSALRAQRLIGHSAYRVAPAAVAGIMAGSHLGHVGEGALVFVSMLIASVLLDTERYPMHLMPLAALAMRIFMPVLGAAIALGTLQMVGNDIHVPSMFAPVAGAWIVLAFASWNKSRFDASRRVRIAVIGSERLARGLDEELHNNSIRSYQVVGWLATGTDAVAEDTEQEGPIQLGSLSQVRAVVETRGIDLLVHSTGDPTEEGPSSPGRLEVFERVAAACLDLPVRLIEATQLYEELLGHVPLGRSTSAWFQYLMHPRYRAGSPASKRAFDLTVSSLMALLLAPMMAAFALAIKLSDGGPVFYRQRRIGEGGREFEMLKLRSMRVDAEASGAEWAEADDPRITRVGRLLRRIHVDELPQLWNVLKGEMTLVGPRPERRELIVELEQKLPYYDRRHLVKPGLAGWAQARCGYAGSREGTGWKLCHDLYYLKHRSLYFDALIMVETLQVAFRGMQFGVRAPQDQFILGAEAEVRS